MTRSSDLALRQAVASRTRRAHLARVERQIERRARSLILTTRIKSRPSREDGADWTPAVDRRFRELVARLSFERRREVDMLSPASAQQQLVTTGGAAARPPRGARTDQGASFHHRPEEGTMPQLTIETTYHLPVYRRRNYGADSVEEACRLAIVDEGWDDAREDVDTSGDTYVTGIWENGKDNTGAAIPIPEQFDERVQRKAKLFDALLTLLKEPAQPMGLSRHDFERWLPRALTVIARAEAIISDNGVQPGRS